MFQSDLFADSEPARSAYKPDPERVRRRLARILEEARRPDGPGWSAAQTSLYRTIVPNMTRWLPEDEAKRWRNEFDAVMAQLDEAA